MKSKLRLGDEFDADLKEKVSWIRSSFTKDQYCITDEGFLINDIYVEFTKEKYATLYLLHWSKQ